MFGYTRSELLGKRVEMLMPNVIARLHGVFISKYLQTMKTSIINTETLLFGKHKTKYIFPFLAFIKPLEDSTLQTLHFSCFVKIEKMLNTVGYIMTLDDGHLLEMSCGVKQLLGVTLENLVIDKKVTSWVDISFIE